LQAGLEIPMPANFKYADQPYVIRMDDGSWVCIMTIGTLGEVKGSTNYSIAAVSRDRGATWSPFVQCNHTYAVPLRTTSGRVYSIFRWRNSGPAVRIESQPYEKLV
jgi:hypothetical protein